ncbi:hypothetical protein JWG41_05360 [Leptospira sp. 201903075]|uniref:hypothetical protein n=1 Tax=Leptospira chreensis TaxID=2810035 RepID=UPI0019642C92|nr:hypothetical protein [Leptospira chreensis]MBM9589863.1 hypothetical protein [Leptospira chreensis]
MNFSLFYNVVLKWDLHYEDDGVGDCEEGSSLLSLVSMISAPGIWRAWSAFWQTGANADPEGARSLQVGLGKT